MILLLMALIACGGDTTEQENTTDAKTTDVPAVPVTNETAEVKQALKNNTKPTSDKVTVETTDQTENTETKTETEAEE